jgi:hypothetical protein
VLQIIAVVDSSVPIFVDEELERYLWMTRCKVPPLLMMTSVEVI